MSKTAHGSISAVFITVVLLLTANATASETKNSARQGFYVGADIGVSVPDDLDSTRTNNGIKTNCDQWLGGRHARMMALHGATSTGAECSPRALPGRPNSFDLGTGFLAGVNLGYAVHDFRFEAEYFRREQSGERSALNVPGDPKQAEFVERSEKISDFRADNFFANVYYDFHNMLSARVTPYLGVGLGKDARANGLFGSIHPNKQPRDTPCIETKSQRGRAGLVSRRSAVRHVVWVSMDSGPGLRME